MWLRCRPTGTVGSIVGHGTRTRSCQTSLAIRRDICHVSFDIWHLSFSLLLVLELRLSLLEEGTDPLVDVLRIGQADELIRFDL